MSASRAASPVEAGVVTDQDGASDPARRREQIAKEAAETPRLVEGGQLDVAVSRILRRLPKVMDRLGS